MPHDTRADGAFFSVADGDNVTHQIRVPASFIARAHWLAGRMPIEIDAAGHRRMPTHSTVLREAMRIGLETLIETLK